MADIKGMDQLSRNLASLGQKLGTKVLRQAAMQVTTPAFKEMKASIPVGKVAHRTHKGRLVAPGFAKRSVARRSIARRGRVYITMGIKNEAFYGVHFVDKGTKKMKAQSWFKKNFINRVPQMERDFSTILKDKIRKAIR